MKKNIVLIGFMGSGKTMVAKAIAKQLGWNVVSTDEIVTRQEGMDINAIFSIKGEPYFRELESRVIKTISNQTNLIVDCGGGVVLNPNNFTELRKNGTIFHLKATPEVIYARIKNESHRPLINGPNPLGQIQQLYEQRLPLYNQADFMIDASGASIKETVAQILSKVNL